MATLAASSRTRRQTAGRRMNALVGKALEEDDTFWNHETWKDEDDSGNESFHESDEDSTLRKDEFDSDFDDSESDHEEEDVAAGEAEERELQKSERSNRQQQQQHRKGAYVDTKGKKKSGGRRFHGGVKRIMGEGFNAGIVLNFPPNRTSDSNSAAVAAISLAKSSPSTEVGRDTSVEGADTKVASRNVSLPFPSKTSRKSGDPVLSASTLASSRERRSTHGVRKLREIRSTPARRSSPSSSRKISSSHPLSRSAKRKRYAQEELLLEAIHETEPDNERWLLGRKRVQDQNEKVASGNALREHFRGKVIQKFHSRRGCLITLTFPEMDAVPEILTRQQRQKNRTGQQLNMQDPEASRDSASFSSGTATPMVKQRFKSGRCVITDKPAKYIDPLTGYPYFDVSAFKEVRERHKSGIPIVGGHSQDKAREYTQNCPADIDSSCCNLTSDANKPCVDKSVEDKTLQMNEPSTSSGKLSPSAVAKMPVDSKMPFQSPTPVSKPAMNGRTSTASRFSTGEDKHNQNSNATILPAHLGFAWNGTNGSSDACDSPVSPSRRRLSRRKWKPSEKVLETIAMSPVKDGVIATPPGLRIKPQQLAAAHSDSNSNGNLLSIVLPAPPLTDIEKSEVAASHSIKRADHLPGGIHKLNFIAGNSHASQGKPSTIDRKIKGKASYKKREIADKVPKDEYDQGEQTKTASHDVLATVSHSDKEAHIRALGKNAERGKAMKIPSPELERQLHKLYVVPQKSNDGKSRAGDTQVDPCYITQNDLIMEVINSYSKRHESDQEKANTDQEKNEKPL